MHQRAEHGGIHRCAALVDQPGGADAHQHQLAAQRPGWQGACQQVGGRVALGRHPRCAVGHQRHGLRVHRHPQTAGRTAQQQRLQGAVCRLQRQRRRRPRPAQPHTRHGQRQRGLHTLLVLHQQRQAPHRAIGIDHRIEMAGALAGRPLQQRQVAAVAGPGQQRLGLPTQHGGGHQRRWQHPHIGGARFIGQVKAQHHRPLAQHGRQLRIAIELRAQCLPGAAQGRILAQRALQQLVDRRCARAVVGLGQHQVQTDQPGALYRGGLLQQPGQQAAWPGPAAMGGQRPFVDVEHHHLRVGLARCQQSQAQVVKGRFQPLQRRWPQRPVRQQGEQQHQQRRPGASQPAHARPLQHRRCCLSGS